MGPSVQDINLSGELVSGAIKELLDLNSSESHQQVETKIEPLGLETIEKSRDEYRLVKTS